MTLVPGFVFIDTNILAYARDRRDSRKQDIAAAWLFTLAGERRGRLSWQVLVEFYAVATHPKKLALLAAEAQADILALQVWNPILPDAGLLRRAWSIQDRLAFSWWDAMIVAAALQAGCQTLLSEDLQHGQIIDDRLIILDPFAEDAPSPPVKSSSARWTPAPDAHKLE
jgi:predicted nucleic acid-binding protein